MEASWCMLFFRGGQEGRFQTSQLTFDSRRRATYGGLGQSWSSPPTALSGLRFRQPPAPPEFRIKEYWIMQVTSVEQFIDFNMVAIDQLLAEIMKAKPASGNPQGQALSYFDIQAITAKLKGLYRGPLGSVPAQIETACGLAEVLLAPSKTEKEKIIKNVASISGGAAGLAMIIGGIGTALGWGAGIITAVGTFFAGASVAGPVGWIAGGVAVAAIAGYFALKKDDPQLSEKAINALKQGMREAIPSVWAEHQEKILAFDYVQKK
jgi:hypothetical protein